MAAHTPDLLAEMDALIEAASALLNTVTCTRGRGPEDADCHEHEEWAADDLKARVAAARAAIAKAEGAQ